jgi:HK97 family phage major capsid protein
VQRSFGLEILSFEPGACDTERLEAGCVPLLVNHDFERAIGQLISYRIGTTHPKKAYGVAKLGNSALARETLADMQSGCRPSLSAGYLIKSMRLLKRGEGDEQSVYLVSSWCPCEVSSIPVPADTSCTLTRSLDDGQLYDAIITNPLSTRSIPPDKFMLPPDDSYDSPFKPRSNASARLTKVVEDAYSLSRVLALGKKLDGFELEVSNTLARERGLDVAGVLIPMEALLMTRADDSVTDSGGTVGGALVQTTVQQTIADSLRPFSAVVAAGAQVITNLVGNFNYVRRATYIPNGWQSSENTTPTATGPTFSVLSLSPLRIAIESRVSKQLLEQSENRSLETFLKQTLLKDVAATLDGACLTGTGSGGQPTGLLTQLENTGGPPYSLDKLAIGVTNGSGGATWTSVLDQQYHVQQNNVSDDLTMAYVTSPKAKRFLQSAPIIGTTFPKFIWSKNNTVGGYPAYQTSFLSGTNQIIFGRSSDFVITIWGIDVLSDPYTNAGSNMVRLLVNVLCNCGTLRGISFCRSEDSASGP